MLTDLQIKDTFVKRDDIDMVLYSMKTKIDLDLNTCDSQSAKTNILKSFWSRFLR